MKECSKCGESLGADEFYARSKRRGGLRAACKACLGVQTASLYVKVRGRRAVQNRERRLRVVYGLTVGQYDAMLVAQDGRCAICRRHHSVLRRPLVVDHDHETGAVRALLCDNCNQFLGMWDSPRGRAAAEYLKAHS